MNLNDADGMRELAAKLQNGSRGNPEIMSDGVALLLRHAATQAETGYVTPAECAAACHKGFGWPAAVTTIGVILAVTGLVLRLST